MAQQLEDARTRLKPAGQSTNIGGGVQAARLGQASTNLDRRATVMLIQ